MIDWNKLEDRHMKGDTPFGKVWIRLDCKGKVTSMYTLFGETQKYLPTETWTEDIVGAQLKLEEICYREKATREWGESLRSKQ